MGSFKETIAAARDVTIVTGIALFLIGFVYRDSYFDALGIPTHAITTDANETIVYATTVITLQWFWFAILGLVVYGVVKGIRMLEAAAHITGALRARLLMVVAVVAVLSLLWVGEMAAVTAGTRVAHDVLTEHDVHFSTLAFDGKIPAEYQALLKHDVGDATSHLVIVTESVDSYFVVRTSPQLAANQWSSVFRLPKSLVRAVRTFPK